MPYVLSATCTAYPILFGEILDKVAEPTETNHELVWLNAGDCYDKLFLAHQRWAVSVAVENTRKQ